MDINNFPWLELIDYPAFCVKDGVVIATNTSAEQRQFLVGMDINEIVTEQKDIYKTFENGSLYLHINMCGIPSPASIVRTKDYDIFRIHRREDDDILKALNLAGSQLIGPLSDLMTIADQQLSKMPNKTKQERIQDSRFHKHLYEMLRIVGNMSDVGSYARTCTIPMETANLVSLIGEIVEKAQDLFACSHIELVYNNPTQPVFGLVNPDRIERAIYNLLSNAAKFARKGSTVEASLTATDKRLTFTLCNTNSENVSAQDLWRQYRREPSLEDPRKGLGLGMTLISAIAAAHGGTILADNPSSDQTRITFSIPIVPGKGEQLRSPIVRMSDYAGGRDKGLIELSDVLPAEAYHRYK